MHAPKHVSTLRTSIFFALVMLYWICLSSCSAEIRASADWARQEEAGGSPVTTLERTLYNIGYFDEDDFDNGPNDSREAADTKGGAPGYFGVQGGLEFIGKGANYDAVSGGGSTTLHYLEVPIYGMYNYSIAPGSKLFGGLGPYFAYGIGGKEKFASMSTPSFGESAGGYKRFDAGLAIQAGYKYKVASLSFNYDLGMTNVAYPVTDITAKNRSFSINIGSSLSALLGRH